MRAWLMRTTGWWVSSLAAVIMVTVFFADTACARGIDPSANLAMPAEHTLGLAHAAKRSPEASLLAASGGGGGADHHGHYVLYFLFFSLGMGALTKYVITQWLRIGLPYTVWMLLLGICLGIFSNLTKYPDLNGEETFLYNTSGNEHMV